MKRIMLLGCDEFCGNQRYLFAQEVAVDDVVAADLLAKRDDAGREMFVDVAQVNMSPTELRLTEWTIPVMRGPYMFHCAEPRAVPAVVADVLLRMQRNGKPVFIAATPPKPKKG